jgi:O-antigen/teichoic acid export membrane protein
MAVVNHIKSTFKHALIYGGAGLIGKAIGFIMLPIYSHQLQAEGYGVIGMIDMVLSVMTLLIGYGISGAMSRFYYETDDERRRKTIVSTTIILMFFLVILVTLPVLLFYQQVAWLAFGRADWGQYIVLAVLAFMASITAKNAENYILIRQRSVFLSVVSLLRLIISLSLNIYFIVYLQMGVLGYLYASLIDATGYSLFMHVNALRQVGLTFDRAFAKEVVTFSFPLLPGYLAMFVRGNADRILLRTFLGLAQVGVFEVLFKFATLIGFFAVVPFTKIWMVKRYEICDQDDGPVIIARVFTYHMAVLLFLALLLSLEIPVVLKLLTPQEFWLSGYIVFFAVMSRVINAAYYHIYFGLLYAKKMFKVSLIQISSAVISLALTVPLIWEYGLPGAVLASLLSIMVQCAIAYVLSTPYYRIPFEWRAVARMLGLSAGMFVAAKNFSIAGTPVADWIRLTVAPWLHEVGTMVYLDRLRNGKILNYLVDGLPLVVDGGLLLLYSLLFIVGLVILRVIPLTMVGHVLNMDNFRKPFRILTWRQS